MTEFAIADEVVADAVRRARELAPAIAARALQTDRERHLPDETIAELADSGLVALMAPRRHGGQEASLEALIGAVIEMGKVCGSTAWLLCIYGIHNWLAGLFSEELQDELFGSASPLLFAGSWAPSGAATAVPGGYRVTGRWQFGSGIWHGSWASVAAVVQQAQDGEGVDGSDGAKNRKFPDIRTFMIPRSDLEVIDTWYTSGLRGTGSMDIAVDDVFVPAHRAEKFAPLVLGTSPSAQRYGAASYRLPLFCALSNVAAAPAVGMALGTVDAFTEKVKNRVMRYSMEQQAKLATAHRRMGHVGAQAESARTLLLNTVRTITGKLAAGRELTVQDRVAVRRNCAYVVEVCKSAIGEAVEASGASAQYEDSVLQRHLRDVNTLSTHVVYDTDSAYELFGRVELGLPPGSFAF